MEAKTSLERIFRGFAVTRQEKDAARAFEVLQQQLCNELPHLIALDQITLKDAVSLLATIEDRAKLPDGAGGDGSVEEGFRKFLTADEETQHHKATPTKESRKVQVQ